MKKLLVLMLVLGLTSIAGASNVDKIIQLTADGKVVDVYPPFDVPSLEMSDSVTLGIELADGYAMDSMDLTLSVKGAGSISLPDTPEDIIVGNFESWSKLVVNPGPKGIDNIVGVSFGAVDGKIVDLITFHSDGIGDVVISLAPAPGGVNNLIDIGPVGADVMGSVLIRIPEPMTVALLGLGSLFLLRRRKF